jgi:hypothetical protein
MTSHLFTERSYQFLLRHPFRLEPYIRDLVLTLKAYVLEQTLEDRTVTVSFDVPATWWEHLKQRLGWRRVRTKTLSRVVKFEVKAAYPEATVDVPLGGPAIFSKVTDIGRGLVV